MPNQSSNAGHKPERTCVVCGRKTDGTELLAFFMLQNDIVFDINKKVQIRKRYVCHENGCIDGLDKWQAKYRKKAARNK